VLCSITLWVRTTQFEIKNFLHLDYPCGKPQGILKLKKKYLYSESKKPRDSTRLTQEIKVNMDGIADSLLKSDYYYCFLVKICVILWFAKQIQKKYPAPFHRPLSSSPSSYKCIFTTDSKSGELQKQKRNGF
jgi:hypothetical protein